MAPTVPSLEPTEFVAGDYVAWNVSDATYPPSEGWALSYAFAGPTPFELSATASPPEITANLTTGLYEVRIPASVTESLTPGTYSWSRYATLGAERYTTKSSSLVVRADKVGAEAAPTKAEAELATIEAMISALQAKVIAAGGVKAFAVGSRSVTYRDQLELKELKRQRGFLRAQVRSERNPGFFGRTIGVAFRAPR